MVGQLARCEQRSGPRSGHGMLFFRFFIRRRSALDGRLPALSDLARRKRLQRAVVAPAMRFGVVIERATVIRPDDLMDRQTALADSGR